MGESIAQFKFLEKVKLSYLKYAGNILNILKELDMPQTDENVKYIRKLVGKFKKQESHNVKVLVANTLTQHILLGHQSRVCNLREMLAALESRVQDEVSICCAAPTRVEGEIKVCLACQLECRTKIVDREKILDIRLGILEQLREEDKMLTEFAVKMGYTNKEEPPPQQVVKQNNVIIMGGGGKGTNIKSADEISKLPPLERDTLIHRLEKSIIEIDIEPSPEIEENGQKPT